MASSILASLWLLVGLGAVLTMLWGLGRTGKPERARVVRVAHRCLGFLFSAGYVIFLVDMMPKLAANGPLLPTPYVIHAYLGLALFPMLLVKHLVVRVFKRYRPALPYLGVLILVLAFPLASYTGLYRVGLWLKGPMVTVRSEGLGTEREVSVAAGRAVFQNKCGRCHMLKTVYLYRRPEEEWRLTVSRMTSKDRGLIEEYQAEAILGYLAHELGPVER